MALDVRPVDTNIIPVGADVNTPGTDYNARAAAGYFKRLLVLSAGTVQVITADGSTPAATPSLPAGTVIDLACTKLVGAGTTATCWLFY